MAAALSSALVLGACKEWPPWRAAAPDAAPADTRPPAPDLAPDGPPPCGEPGQPACPMEAWMESELSGPLQTREWEQLGRSLRVLAADAPERFPRWTEWASKGASAARTKDADAVRAACKACHNAYREEFRHRSPGRPAPRS